MLSSQSAFFSALPFCVTMDISVFSTGISQKMTAVTLCCLMLSISWSTHTSIGFCICVPTATRLDGGGRRSFCN